MNEGLSRGRGKRRAESGDGFKVEKCSFGEVFDMGFKGERRVDDDAQISYFRGSGGKIVRDRELRKVYLFK